MKKFLIGLGVVVAILAGLAWFFVLDGAGPARAEGVFDLAAYRALVADDAAEVLPQEARIDIAGESQAPSFAAEAGNFSGPRTFAYASFQLTAPDGGVVIDGAVDAATLAEMAQGKGRFDEHAYARILDAMTHANAVMITHEHLDHVMAIARHNDPASLAPHLRLTRTQRDALAQFAIGGNLAPEIAGAATVEITGPTRIAPGVVAAPAPGHTPGSIVIYARTPAHEYLFIGDIAWLYDSVRDVRGRPRLIRILMPTVDPDRASVLRQLRALHDMAEANPDLIIVPAHDKAYLAGLIESGALQNGFAPPPEN